MGHNFPLVYSYHLYHFAEDIERGHSPFYSTIFDQRCLSLILYILAGDRDPQAQCSAVLYSLRCEWVYYEQVALGPNNLGNIIFYKFVLGFPMLNSM